MQGFIGAPASHSASLHDSRGLALLPKHPGAFFHDLLPKLFRTSISGVFLAQTLPNRRITYSDARIFA